VSNRGDVKYKRDATVGRGQMMLSDTVACYVARLRYKSR